MSADTTDDRQRFIEAGMSVLGWSEEYAAEVYEAILEMNRDPALLWKALDRLCADVLKHREESKP